MVPDPTMLLALVNVKLVLVPSPRVPVDNVSVPAPDKVRLEFSRMIPELVKFIEPSLII